MGSFRLDQLDYVGSIQDQNSGFHLAIGTGGKWHTGCFIQLYLLVDPEDGVIADAKYQAFASKNIVHAMEVLCAFCLRKNYRQASRISAEILEKEVGASIEQINICLEALDECVDHSAHIDVKGELVTPMPLGDEEGRPVEGFDKLDKEEKLKIIEHVLDEKVRPYIAMDEGGLEVEDLVGSELTVRYTGACTTCPSSIGGTLGYIEKTLCTHVDPSLLVKPVFEYNQQMSLPVM